MGIKLRQSTNGRELVGTLAGQVPVWNPATQEWDVGAPPGDLRTTGSYRLTNGASTIDFTASGGNWTRLSNGGCIQDDEATEWVFNNLTFALTFTPADPLTTGRWLARVFASFDASGVPPVAPTVLYQGISVNDDLAPPVTPIDNLGGKQNDYLIPTKVVTTIGCERVFTAADGTTLWPVFGYDAVVINLLALTLSLTPIR